MKIDEVVAGTTERSNFLEITLIILTYLLVKTNGNHYQNFLINF